MKARIPALISIVILATMIVGAVLLQTRAQTVETINVVYDPKYYTWDNTPASPWNAEIWRQKVADYGNYSSILLEGTYTPIATPYPALHGPRLIVPFNGEDVKAVIFTKLPTHMGVLIPGTYKLKLMVSGTLIDGTPIAGYGTIVVTVPPPPP